MRLRFKFTAMFFCLLTVGFAAQKNDSRLNEMFGLPSFVFRMHQFQSEEKDLTKLEINIALVNDVLQFVREENGRYRAGFRISMDLIDGQNEHVGEKLGAKKIIAETFEQTNSRSLYNKDQFVYNIKPGEHELQLEITDIETRKHLIRKFPLKIKSFHGDSLQISSILFLEPGDHADSLQYNLPKIYVSAQTGVPIRFFVSGLAARDSVSVGYSLKDWAGEVVKSWEESRFSESQNLRFDHDLASSIEDAGNYTLEISCKQGVKTARASSRFSVKYEIRQNDAARSIFGEDTYLALKYVMRRSDYQAILNASASEREPLIKAFWDARNPEPGSLENPIRDEFYRRVDFANKHFSVLALQQTGWEADRGKKYIVFGDPTSVQTQTDQFGAATIQMWYYKEIDKRFVFRDKKGNNDFKLVSSE